MRKQSSTPLESSFKIIAHDFVQQNGVNARSPQRRSPGRPVVRPRTARLDDENSLMHESKKKNQATNKEDQEQQLTEIERNIKANQVKLATNQIVALTREYRERYDKGSPEFLLQMRELVKRSCIAAIVQLNESDSAHLSLEVLLKLQDLLQSGECGFLPEATVVLWNHFGVAYMRLGQHNNALVYFEKAILFAKRYRVDTQQGRTQLNLSSLLSQMGRHEQALEYALDANRHLRTEVERAQLQDLAHEDASQFQELVNYYAISHYNIGAEYEHLHTYTQAVQQYKCSFEVYEKYQLQKVFEKNYFRFREQHLTAKEKNAQNASVMQAVVQAPYAQAVSALRTAPAAQLFLAPVVRTSGSPRQNAAKLTTVSASSPDATSQPKRHHQVPYGGLPRGGSSHSPRVVRSVARLSQASNNSSFDIDSAGQSINSSGRMPQENNFFFNNALKRSKAQFARSPPPPKQKQAPSVRYKRLLPRQQDDYTNQGSSIGDNTLSLRNQSGSEEERGEQRRQKNQKKQPAALDSSFFDAEESSYMPRHKKDLDIMGVLSWSSDAIDSDEEVVHKDTRLNFLATLNHYVTKRDLHFDEEARLRDELKRQREGKEEQMKLKLARLEEFIRKAQEEKEQQLRELQQQKLFEQCQKIMRSSLQRQRVLCTLRRWRAFCALRQRERRASLLRLVEERYKIYRARQIQRAYRHYTVEKRRRVHRKAFLRHAVIVFISAKRIQKLVQQCGERNRIKAAQALLVQAQRPSALARVVLTLQRLVRAKMALERVQLQRLRRQPRQRLLLKRHFVRLRMSKNASELTAQFYLLYFVEELHSHSLNCVLRNLSTRRLQELYFTAAEVLKDLQQFGTAIAVATVEQQPELASALWVEDNWRFVIREDEEVVMDRYAKSVQDAQQRRVAADNILHLQGRTQKREDSDEEQDLNESERRQKQYVRMADRFRSNMRSVLKLQALLRAVVVRRRLEVRRQARIVLKRNFKQFHIQQEVHEHIVLTLFETGGAQELDDFVVTGFNLTQRKRLEACPFPRELLQNSLRQGNSRYWLELLYIDIDALSIHLSDIADDALQKRALAQALQTPLPVHTLLQSDEDKLALVTRLQAIWRAITVRESLYYATRRENFTHLLRDFDPYRDVRLTQHLSGKDSRRNTIMTRRNTMMRLHEHKKIRSVAVRRPPPIFQASKNRIMLARSFQIIEEQYIYLLSVHADDIFTQLFIVALRLERLKNLGKTSGAAAQAAEKRDKVEQKQKLKNFLSLKTLKYYTNALLQAGELKRKAGRTVLQVPNIDEVIEKKGSGTQRVEDRQQIATHESQLKRRNFRKNLDKLFLYNEVSPFLRPPAKEYAFIENEKQKRQINKIALRQQGKRRFVLSEGAGVDASSAAAVPLQQSSNEGFALSDYDQEGADKQQKPEEDEEEEEGTDHPFIVELEDARDRQLRDIKKIAEAVRTLIRQQRKYFLFRRLAHRRENRNRGIPGLEEEFQKRELEVTSTHLRFMMRAVAAQQDLPFALIELYLHPTDKCFVVLVRNLPSLHVHQRVLVPLQQLALTDSYLKLELNLQLHIVRKLVALLVRRDKKKIAVVQFPVAASGESIKEGNKISTAENEVPQKLEDEYKRVIKVDEFQRDKYMLLLMQWKEKFFQFKIKTMFYWYYHVQTREVCVIVRGNSEKWLKVNERFTLSLYSSELAEQVNTLLHEAQTSINGPTPQEAAHTRELLVPHLRSVRKHMQKEQPTARTLTLKISPTLYAEERRMRAIREMQRSVRREQLRTHLHAAQVKQQQKVFHIKCLLHFSDTYISHGNAYFDRTQAQNVLMHLRGERKARQKHGIVERLHLVVGVIDTLRVFYGAKQYQHFDFLTESSDNVRRKLRKVADSEFKKLVDRLVRRERDDVMSTLKKHRSKDEVIVQRVQQVWRRHQKRMRLEIKSMREDREQRDELQFGKLITKKIIVWNENHYFMRCYAKGTCLHFYAFDYGQKSRPRLYGVFDARATPLPAHLFTVHEFNTAAYAANPIVCAAQICTFLCQRLSFENPPNITFEVLKTDAQLEDERSETRQIHQTQAQLLASVLKFDVVYHSRKKFQPLPVVRESEEQLQHFVGQEEKKVYEEERKEEELVHIDVNVRRLEGLKQKALELRSMTEAMKQATERIAHGIRLTREGEFVMDVSDFDPSNVMISRRQLLHREKLKRPAPQDAERPYSQVLQKGIKIDDCFQKFLVRISAVEVPMQTLANVSSDTVYEQCKRMMQIAATHLTKGVTLSWSITPQEFSYLSDTKSPEDGARALIRRVFITGGVTAQNFAERLKLHSNSSSKAALLVPPTTTTKQQTSTVQKIEVKGAIDQKQVVVQKNQLKKPKMVILTLKLKERHNFAKVPHEIILISEEQLAFLQKKMHECVYALKYRHHKQHLKALNGHLVGKKISLLEEQDYIIAVVLVVTDNSKEYHIMAWSLNNFRLLQTTMAWQDAIESLLPDIVLMNAIVDSLFMYQDGEEQTLILNASFLEPLLNEYKMKIQ